ncbi:right-handed parallel beta-helix repeat-containing protein [Cellulomonas septica]|uniref:Right handed beta helix domain-containing protein n=1 Tax=Cellulomonas septica TaxID=285080 RepID=A0ABX1K1J2_9CELL|nr:right-handed parallel beta-helix repeat-containing protein [Cellulomonas septica]NKY39381.1 hypothetical protein [Cellulomonas septica]
MRLPSVLSCLVLAAGGVLVATPSLAATPVPGCGAVLTTDSVLTADLTCPAGVGGLELAEGVTLDLGGHTLRGPGSGVGVLVQVLGDAGVHDGTIAGWSTGIRNDEPEFEIDGVVTIADVTFTENGTGVDPSGRWGASGKTYEVSDSVFTANSDGIGAFYGFAHVVRSVFTGNGTAVNLITAGVAIEDSRIEHNSTGLHCDESGCSVERTTLADNGVAVDARFFGADIVDSVVERNEVGLASFSVWGVNHVSGTEFLDNGTAIDLQTSSAEIVDNVFRGNGLGFRTDGSDPTWFPETLLRGNLFERNDDAIFFDEIEGGPNTRLTKNTANYNRGWGIHAPGVVDGGGNKAKGNGNQPQCVGVVCKGSKPRS